ncbi:MAG: rod shape-determining protein MreC [Parcubacteria group bacterium]|nr:rod shape-determining protein MreC [Parcubacteria group bacterium]
MKRSRVKFSPLKIFVILAVFAAIIFWGNFKKSDFFKNFIIRLVSYPIGKIEKRKNSSTKKITEKDIMSLETKIKELERENDNLKNLLTLDKKENKNRFLPANFVLKLGPENGAMIIINVGSKEGVAEKDAVMQEGKFLVGRVVKVWPDFSRVRLITDPDEVIAVRTLNSKIPGTLSGSFGLILKMEFLSDSNPENNEIILTSGEDGYEAGLIAGRISRVRIKEGESIKEAIIEPAFSDFDELAVIFNPIKQ